jgi:hypothetical protein
MPRELLSCFQDDELERAPFRSPVPRKHREIATHGTLLARAEMPLLLYRQDCEVADQWFWGEIARMTGRAREALVRSDGDRAPRLRDGLRRPLKALEVLFNRPLFLFDQALMVSSVYETSGDLVFVHELGSSDGDAARQHAVTLEWFQ